MADATPLRVPLPILGSGENSEKIIRSSTSAELVFAVVGHVGSGTSTIAKMLSALLEDETRVGGAFETTIFSARDAIALWAERAKIKRGAGEKSDLNVSIEFQNIGDKMRLDTGDHSAVARALLKSIRVKRALSRGVIVEPGKPVEPDNKRRAYIVDALRHPAEAHLFRSVYQNAFTLIGVVCSEEERLQRLVDKYSNAGRQSAESFMKRDAQSGVAHGQRVSDTFHLSDYFIDNSARREVDRKPNPHWRVHEELSRLVKLVTHSEIVRPTASESAMFHAFGAMRKSACLSRQVGAAILDRGGNIVATGTNEAPRAGGGVYADDDTTGGDDGRCAFRENDGDQPYCSNTREQNAIVDELSATVRQHFSSVVELSQFNTEVKSHLIAGLAQGLDDALRSSRITQLLEFSRAVHAEMDAILSAGRAKAEIVGGRLFVTTFPCHYCARHIVASGIDEVHYIEPYPKSLAIKLHDDSITPHMKGWMPPSRDGKRVLFRPFTGAGPNLFARAFLKDRDLKDKRSGEMKMGAPIWNSAFHELLVSYAELEARLEVRDE